MSQSRASAASAAAAPGAGVCVAICVSKKPLSSGMNPARLDRRPVGAADVAGQGEAVEVERQVVLGCEIVAERADEMQQHLVAVADHQRAAHRLRPVRGGQRRRGDVERVRPSRRGSARGRRGSRAPRPARRARPARARSVATSRPVRSRKRGPRSASPTTCASARSASVSAASSASEGGRHCGRRSGARAGGRRGQCRRVPERRGRARLNDFVEGVVALCHWKQCCDMRAKPMTGACGRRDRANRRRSASSLRWRLCGACPGLGKAGRSCSTSRSAIAAIRDGALDLLIIAPRHDWWAECAEVAELQAAAVAGANRGSGDGAARVMPRRWRSPSTAVSPTASAYPFDAAEVAVRVGALLRRKRAADRRRAAAAEVRRLAMTDTVTGLWNRHFLRHRPRRQDRRGDGVGPTAFAADDRHRPVQADQRPPRPRYRRQGLARCRRPVSRRHPRQRRARALRRRRTRPRHARYRRCGRVGRGRAAARLVADGTTEVPFSVTISVGVAELGFDEPATSLITRADKALYIAKLDGRDRVAAARRSATAR